ncbi:MAG: hypothetical protein ACXVA9_08235 [Bdellovibrionales bacterium]
MNGFALGFGIIFVLANLSAVANAIENVNCHPETQWAWYQEPNKDYYFKFVEAGGQTVTIYAPSKAACEARAKSIVPGITTRSCDCEPGIDQTWAIIAGKKSPKYSLICRDFDPQGRMLNSTEVAEFVKLRDSDPRSTCLDRASEVESSKEPLGK